MELCDRFEVVWLFLLQTGILRRLTFVIENSSFVVEPKLELLPH